MPLDNSQCKNAKPEDNSYKLFDNEFLYLTVYPNGEKRWRFCVTSSGTRYQFGLGSYPEVSLDDARKKGEEIYLFYEEKISEEARAKLIHKDYENLKQKNLPSYLVLKLEDHGFSLGEIATMLDTSIEDVEALRESSLEHLTLKL